MSSSTPLKSAIPSSQALAVKRTQLANTRTLLAYVRTALGCAGFAVAVEKLYPGEQGALPAALAAETTPAWRESVCVGADKFEKKLMRSMQGGVV